MSETYQVHLFYEEWSRQWVVKLAKMGGIISIHRSAPGQRERAAGIAAELAAFLNAPLVETKACNK